MSIEHLGMFFRSIIGGYITTPCITIVSAHLVGSGVSPPSCTPNFFETPRRLEASSANI